jgi:hypothetical protein
MKRKEREEKNKKNNETCQAYRALLARSWCRHMGRLDGRQEVSVHRLLAEQCQQHCNELPHLQPVERSITQPWGLVGSVRLGRALFRGSLGFLRVPPRCWDERIRRGGLFLSLSARCQFCGTSFQNGPLGVLPVIQSRPKTRVLQIDGSRGQRPEDRS